MRHTDDDVEQTARRFERIADELDPTTAEVDQTDDPGRLPPSPRHCVQTKPGCERPSKLPVPTAGHGIRSRSPLECPGKQHASGSPTKHTPREWGFSSPRDDVALTGMATAAGQLWAGAPAKCCRTAATRFSRTLDRTGCGRPQSSKWLGRRLLVSPGGSACHPEMKRQ